VPIFNNECVAGVSVIQSWIDLLIMIVSPGGALIELAPKIAKLLKCQK